MAYEQDYCSEDVKTMKYELNEFGKVCYYDEKIKKIVYNTMSDAMNAYCAIQATEMGRHRWIESEKAHTDLGTKKIQEWIIKYSGFFRDYWQRTHVFMPPPK